MFRKKALTVLEILIAIAILSFVFIPLVQVFNTSYTGSLKASDVSLGTELANSLIELFKFKETGSFEDANVFKKRKYVTVLEILGKSEKVTLKETDIQKLLDEELKDLPSQKAIDRFTRTLIIEASDEKANFLTRYGVEKQPVYFKLTAIVEWKARKIGAAQAGKKKGKIILRSIVANNNPVAPVQL